MTKKNADKRAARARKAARGGKYQSNLRAVGDGSGSNTRLGFFEAISKAILAGFPDAKLSFDDARKRLDVHMRPHSFAFLTPYSAEPEWPVTAWNETKRTNEKHGWECETIDDVLTVLRWPEARPSRAYTSVNEIRDDYENPSKHIWARTAHDHPQPEALTRTYKCQGCEAKLYVHFGETVEEVARMGYENWRKREAGTFASKAPRTLTRSMGVGFIPPACSRTGGTAISDERPVDALEAADAAIPNALNAITSLQAAMRPMASFQPLVNQLAEMRPQTLIERGIKPLADIAALARPMDTFKALTANSLAEMVKPLALTSFADTVSKTSLGSAVEALNAPSLTSAIHALKPFTIESASMQTARMAARLTGEETAVMKAIRMQKRLAGNLGKTGDESPPEDME